MNIIHFQQIKYLSKFIIIMLLLSFFSCQKQKEPVMECILDQFIEISEIKSDHYIAIEHINGMINGYKKNELLITIQSIEDNFHSTYYYNNLYVTSYKGFTLYASFDFLKKGNVNPNVSVIPNKLEWKEVKIEKKAIVNPDAIEPFYDFKEIQIIYNYKTKKIIDSRGIKGEIIEINCNE